MNNKKKTNDINLGIIKLFLNFSGLISVVLYIVLKNIPAIITAEEKKNYDCLGKSYPKLITNDYLAIGITFAVFILIVIITTIILKANKEKVLDKIAIGIISMLV